MQNLFFGDSMTSGENNGNVSYADYISNSIKIGVSGTTIGEYSIYPVDGNSLLSLIPKHIKEIKEAENIFIEYGINDTTSILVGNVKATQVLVAFVKALDYIKQINPEAKLYFLVAENATISLALSQYKYLRNDYMKNYWSEDAGNAKDWAQLYEEFISVVVSKSDVKIIEMFNNDKEYRDNLDTDGLHPTDKGYRMIAENIKTELYKIWKVA